MAASFAVATGNVPATSPGSVNITSSGFGTPTAALIFLSTAGTNNPQAIGQFGIGFWDGTNDFAVGVSSADAAATMQTSRGASTGDGVAIPLSDATGWQVRASVSNTTDGITLTITEDNTGIERKAVVVLIKGTTNALAAVHTMDGTAGANDITAPGFKPDIVFAATIGSSTGSYKAENILSFGVAHNSSTDTVTQAVQAISSDSTPTTSDTETRVDDGSIAYIAFSSLSIATSIAATDFDASGFSLTATPASSAQVFYLALELANPDDANVQVINSATGTGTSATTGTGFNPDSLLLVQSLCTAVDTTIDGLSITVGATDGTTEASVNMTDDHGLGTSNANARYDTSNILNIRFDDDTVDAVAALSSFDSDGFTLNYSNGSASARKMIAISIGDSTAGGGPSPLVLDAVTYTLSPQDVDMLASRSIAMDPVSYSMSIQDISMLTSRLLTMDAVTYSMSPQDITMAITKIMSLDYVGYSITPQDIALLLSRILTAEAVSFSMSPQDITMNLGVTMTMDPVAFTMSPQDATLLVSSMLTMDAVSFTMSPQDIEITNSTPEYTLVMDSVGYTLTVKDLNMDLGTRLLVMEPAVYALQVEDMIFHVEVTYESSNRLRITLLDAANRITLDDSPHRVIIYDAKNRIEI